MNADPRKQSTPKGVLAKPLTDALLAIATLAEPL